jgi:hypothetical protein
MKLVLAPAVRKYYAEKIGKTAVELSLNNSTITVFVNGNHQDNPALLVNARINEVGDSFVATSDSKVMDASGKKPIYKKGDKVIRQKESVDFLSFAGNNTPTQFAQGAAGFGLNLQVVMQG